METNYTLKRLKLLWPVFALFMLSTFLVNAQVVPLSNTQVNNNTIEGGDTFCSTMTTEVTGTSFTTPAGSGMTLVLGPSVTSATATVSWQWSPTGFDGTWNNIDPTVPASLTFNGQTATLSSALNTTMTYSGVPVEIRGNYEITLGGVLDATTHLRRVVRVVTNDAEQDANNATAPVVFTKLEDQVVNNNLIGPVLNACAITNDITIQGAAATVGGVNVDNLANVSYAWYKGTPSGTVLGTGRILEVDAGDWAFGNTFWRVVSGDCVDTHEASVTIDNNFFGDWYITGLSTVCLGPPTYKKLVTYEGREGSPQAPGAVLSADDFLSFSWTWSDDYGTPEAGTSTQSSFSIVWDESTCNTEAAWVELTVTRDGCSETKKLDIGISKQPIAVVQDDDAICGDAYEGLTATLPTTPCFYGQWTKVAGPGPVSFDPPYSSTDDTQGKVYDATATNPAGNIVDIDEVYCEGTYTFRWSTWSKYCATDYEEVDIEFRAQPSLTKHAETESIVCVYNWRDSSTACGTGALTGHATNSVINDENSAYLAAYLSHIPAGYIGSATETVCTTTPEFWYTWEKVDGPGGVVFRDNDEEGDITGAGLIQTNIHVCALGTYTIKLKVWNKKSATCVDEMEFEVTFEQYFVAEVKDPNRPTAPSTNVLSPFAPKPQWVTEYADAVADNTYPLKARAFRIANGNPWNQADTLAVTTGTWRTILRPDGSNIPVFNNRFDKETNVTVSSYGKYAFLWTVDTDAHHDDELCYIDYPNCLRSTKSVLDYYDCPTCQEGAVVYVEFFPRVAVTVEDDFATCSLVTDLNGTAVRVPKVANMSGVSKYDINRVWEVTHFKNSMVDAAYDATEHPMVRFYDGTNYSKRNIGYIGDQTYMSRNAGGNSYNKVWVRIGDNDIDFSVYGEYTFRHYANIFSDKWNNDYKTGTGSGYNPPYGYHVPGSPFTKTGSGAAPDVALDAKAPFIKAQPHVQTTYQVLGTPPIQDCWRAYHADEEFLTVAFYWKPVATLLVEPTQEKCGNTVELDAVVPPTDNPPYVDARGRWEVEGPGTVTFNPGPNVAQTTATVSEQGHYVFTWIVTNPVSPLDDPKVPCQQATATVEVTFYDTPVANANGPEYGYLYCYTQPDPKAANFDGNHIYLDAQWSILDDTYRTGGWSYELIDAPAGANVKFYDPDKYDYTKASTTWGAQTPGMPNAVAVFSHPGEYKLIWTESNGICATDTDEFEVMFMPSPKVVTLLEVVGPGAQVEPTPVCPGETVHYIVSPNPWTTDDSYIRWIVPEGSNAVIVDRGGLDALGRSTEPWVKVQWIGDDETKNLIEFELIKRETGCLTVQKPAYINFKDFVDEDMIAGTELVAAGSTHTYSVDLYAGLTYAWTINPSSAGTILSGQTTNSVSIRWSETATSATIRVVRTGAEYCQPIPAVPLKNITLAKGSIAGVVRYFNNEETRMPSPFATTYAGGEELPDYFYVGLWESDLTLVEMVAAEPMTVNGKVESVFEFEDIDLTKDYVISVHDGGYLYDDNITDAEGRLAYSYTWRFWGGVNATDALAVSLMAAETDLNEAPYNYNWLGDAPDYGFFFNSVGDVNSTGDVDVTDALTALYRVVGNIAQFPGRTPNFRVAGRMVEEFADMTWDAEFGADDIEFVSPYMEDFEYFGTSPASRFLYVSEVVDLDIDNFLNIYYVATGDVNSSYIPPASGLVKAESAVALEYKGRIDAAIGDVIEIPVRISQNAEVGAITIGMNYNSSLIEVLDVNYEVKNINNDEGMLRVGSITPEFFNANDAVLVVTARVKGEMNGAQLFTLDGVTEFAGVNANVLDVSLNTDLVTANAVTNVVDADITNLSMRNFPNPFNETTTIEYNLPEAGNVTLVVYNSVGQVVTTLVDENQEAGTQQVQLSRSNLSGDGMYIYRISVETQTGTHTATGNVVLMK